MQPVTDGYISPCFLTNWSICQSLWQHTTAWCNTTDNTENISSSMSRGDAGKYLLLHHRQPLACRFCRGAPHALYAIHYHWAFARHTGSPVPCLRTMVNHKVKDILNLKPNLCFPTSHPGINCKNSHIQLSSSKVALHVVFRLVLTPLGNKGLV